MGAASSWSKTVILLGALTGVLLWIGSLFGQQGLLFAFIFVLIMNVGSYWFSDKIVLAMYRAQPVDKKHASGLYHLVGDVAKKVGIPRPKVYIIPTASPNAFATGRSPKHSAVAFTQGILQSLDKRELKAVTAHECSHIKNRDTLIGTIAATIAGVITYIAFMARWAAIFGGMGRGGDRNGNLFELLALTIVTPLIATIIQLAISRTREYMADSTGAQAIKDPKGLAMALKKIHAGIAQKPLRGANKAGASLFIDNPFRGEAFIKLFSTHPPMEERVKRLNEMKV